MKVSNNCIELVKECEGFRANAYKCPAGIWTIGYGETKGVKPGDVTTEPDALRKLLVRLDEFTKEVLTLLKVAPTQGQLDALVSFAYNFGSGALATSTLLRKHNEGDFLAAQAEFLKWNKVTNPVTKKKEVSNGLTKRRRLEAALYGRE